jgi:diaminohydroxyphosphoribosylaminopyrimidine deaminase/5-amino-6-(5-phosphoribosylamino)uracil reductase
VIVAVRDPNPLVAGNGIRQLRRSGIAVESGLLAAEAKSVNEDFFWAITRRRAFVTLKLALTLDGRIADVNGGSKWITAPALRRVVHELRRTHAAVAVGSATLAADDPRLTVRFGAKAKPARIVFSSDETLPPESYFVTHARAARSIVVIRRKAERHVAIDSASGIEYWYTGSSAPAASMAAFTEMAFQQNLTSVFVEGGARVASVLLEAGLVNRIYLFYGNQILGKGTEGVSFRRGLPIAESIILGERRSITVGNDMYITGIPVYAKQQENNGIHS